MTVRMNARMNVTVLPRPRPRARACACGTTRHDPHAVPECDYSFMGNLYAAWGGTAIPTRVSFRCVKCDALFDSTTDLRVRRANR